MKKEYNRFEAYILAKNRGIDMFYVNGVYFLGEKTKAMEEYLQSCDSGNWKYNNEFTPIQNFTLYLESNYKSAKQWAKDKRFTKDEIEKMQNELNK